MSAPRIAMYFFYLSAGAKAKKTAAAEQREKGIFCASESGLSAG